MAANKSYIDDFTSTLNSFRRKPSLHDITIVVKDKKFPAHKVILAAASDYFNALFVSDHFNETNKLDEVTLEHTDCASPDVIEVVLVFIYSGISNGIDKENCFDVLAAACYLQIKHLIKECSDFICDSYKGDHLAFENPLRIVKMACNYGLPELKTLGLTFMARDFKEMAQTDDFRVHMTSDLLGDLLERDDLAVSDEKMVLDAMLKWLQHSWESRRNQAWPLLQKVRLGLIPIEDVKEYICGNLSEILECNKVYYELLEYHTLKHIKPEERKGPLLQAMENAFISRKTIKALLVFPTPSTVRYYRGPRNTEVSYFCESGNTLKQPSKRSII
ncbi:kelch-like protein 12 [Amphiura filiformis]|uniref:kelch-like protein 12 n=1 Tax=Amphiura filiformis TaxID=82378 RepID=UPI003B21A1C8